MSFDQRDDLYVTLELTHVGNEVYRAQLPSTLFIRAHDKIVVSLCDISYITEDLSTFKNVEQPLLAIAIPEYTSGPVIKMVDKSTQTVENEEQSGRGITFEEPFDTPEGRKSELQFVYCRLENAEYTAESLVDSLNVEIKSKLPSRFRKDQCRFLYDKTINRVQLRLDGSQNVPQNERVTLAIYSPLSYYLGFVNYIGPRATACFGTPGGFVTKDMILQKKHAVAQYPPQVATPNKMLVFMDIIQQEVIRGG